LADDAAMARPVKIALAAAFVALVGVIVWQMVQTPDEPVYRGKALSIWLIDSGLDGEGPEPGAYEALLQAGTNAIPTLMRMLRAKDSPLKVQLMALVQKQHIFKIEYTTAYQRNRAAGNAFGILGAKARSAVPALIDIANQHISVASQTSAIDALDYIGPSAKQAVPSLTEWATNADPKVRYFAIHALGGIHADPGRAVPALIKALHDPDPGLPYHAVTALARFGPDAKSAVPALVEFIDRSQDLGFRPTAINDLEAIDPQAAVNLRARLK
jgi:HEAT repeat protein